MSQRPPLPPSPSGGGQARCNKIAITSNIAAWSLGKAEIYGHGHRFLSKDWRGTREKGFLLETPLNVDPGGNQAPPFSFKPLGHQ